MGIRRPEGSPGRADLKETGVWVYTRPIPAKSS